MTTATRPARPAPSSLDDGILALPFFEPRHAEAARRVAVWADRRVASWRADTRGAPALGRRILGELGDAGLLAFLDPAADRADEGDLRSVCLAREALAYADDLADFAFSIQALSATPLLRHGTAEQRSRWLPGMAAGRVQGAFAVSEEAAGSDVAAIGLTATRSGAGYVLDGGKAWIANGDTADLLVVLARTGEGPGALGLTAFLVPGDTPGLRREPVELIAPRAFAHLHFDGCVLPADAVLGRPGGGFPVAMEVLDRFRMTVGAAALGFARHAADAALARARDRRVYGGTLLDLPTVRATLADVEVKLQAAALLVARAAWEADVGNRRYARHSSIAKLYATESAQEIVDACVQVFGAAGLVAGSVTERLYRQVRSLRIYEGPSEVQKAVIAGALDMRRADRLSHRTASGTTEE
jgi:acyl-CoA dehydrogenase